MLVDGWVQAVWHYCTLRGGFLVHQYRDLGLSLYSDPLNFSWFLFWRGYSKHRMVETDPAS